MPTSTSTRGCGLRGGHGFLGGDVWIQEDEWECFWLGAANGRDVGVTSFGAATAAAWERTGYCAGGHGGLAGDPFEGRNK